MLKELWGKFQDPAFHWRKFIIIINLLHDGFIPCTRLVHVCVRALRQRREKFRRFVATDTQLHIAGLHLHVTQLKQMSLAWKVLLSK